MKRKNDEETFVGALLGDWRAFKEYWQSGEFWKDALNENKPPDEDWFFLAEVFLYIVLALTLLVLSLIYLPDISLLLCGAGVGFAFVFPFAPCALLLRYAIFKADQWKKRNE